MTVRGPPGPTGPPGQGTSWLAEPNQSGQGQDSCGCNESLLRLYVKDVKPKLLTGPSGIQGLPGPMVHPFSCPDIKQSTHLI
jgi:hypothetical protein